MTKTDFPPKNVGHSTWHLGHRILPMFLSCLNFSVNLSVASKNYWILSLAVIDSWTDIDFLTSYLYLPVVLKETREKLYVLDGEVSCYLSNLIFPGLLSKSMSFDHVFSVGKLSRTDSERAYRRDLSESESTNQGRLHCWLCAYAIFSTCCS